MWSIIWKFLASIFLLTMFAISAFFEHIPSLIFWGFVLLMERISSAKEEIIKEIQEIKNGK